VPRLKVCGITDAAFAVEAARRGVDYLGLIFAEGSPRRVTVDQAHAIITAVHGGEPQDCKNVRLARSMDGGRAAGVIDGSLVTHVVPQFVGVFVNHDVEDIKKIASCLGIGVIQLHGDYGSYEIASLRAAGYEVWRLFGDHDVAVARDARPYRAVTGDARPYRAVTGDARPYPDAVLLDGRKGTQCGGTGMRADWSLVEPLRLAGRRVVLAGGISAANVTEAVATGADVIDVNSSIETSPGAKSLALLDDLLTAFGRRAGCR